MGLRGRNARPLSKREPFDPSEEKPWQKTYLPREEKVIIFIESLTITSGASAGTRLKLRPWQKKFIREIYKTKKENKGKNAKTIRQVRTAVLCMGRKNGKTQLAACLALCHLCGPEAESRGEVYACANDRFQAGKIFNEMEAIILRNKWLDSRTNISRHRKDIEDLENGSLYCTLTAEAKTKMGLSPSFVVYDELGQARDRELYDAMDSAMGARENPLLLVISTQAASSAAPMSQLIDYGLKLESGDIPRDPSFHLTLYAADEDCDPWDIKSWRKANPALGDFRSLEDVRRLAQQAQRIPAQENAFRNLILNQRCATEARFMEPSAWRRCSGEVEIPVGASVYAGLDLGSTRDLSSFVIAYQHPEDKIIHVKNFTWVPGDLKEKGDQDGAPYESWAREGLVFAAGRTTDPRMIAEKICEVNEVNPIQQLAFDRWRVGEIKREFDSIGVKIPLLEHGQGYKDMSPAVDCVERMVVTEMLRHGGDPVLTWCANNAVISRDPAGGRKFNKSASAYTSKIDALVAMAMALSAMLVKSQQMEKKFDVEALIG